MFPKVEDKQKERTQNYSQNVILSSRHRVLSSHIHTIILGQGFDPRTFQSVASRYTDYGTRPTLPDVAFIFSSRIVALTQNG
jgi:hypothetical protein